MSEPVAVPAAESAAPPAPDFAAFEAAENAKATGGTWPDPAKVTATEPAATTEPVETTTAEPAPVSAATTTTDPAKRRTDAEQKAHVERIRAEKGDGSRKAEKDQAFINERIRQAAEAASAETERRLRAEFAAKQLPAAEPVKVEPPKPVDDPTDPRPNEVDFETYGEFTEKLARWAYRQAKRDDAAEAKATKDREAATAAQRDFETRVSAWDGRRDAFLSVHPQRAAALTAFLDTLLFGTPIGDAVSDSEHGPELADYLVSHPEEAARIGALSPVSAIRALGRLEAQFSSTTSASASAGPAAKRVTSAPAPPTTLSARTADPADPVAAAIASGNFLAFEAEENRRAIASAR